MRTLFEHARIVSPGVDLTDGYLAVNGKKIESVGLCKPKGVFDRIVDLSGLIAVPGFIDIHSHGRSNYDFCDEAPEAHAVIGRSKLEDGVTGFLCTTLSVSEETLHHTLEAAENYKANVKNGATMLGIHLEGPFFNPTCAGAQNPEHLKLPDIRLVDELNTISPVKKVSFSPELPGGLELTRALAERGIMPSGGHTEADYACFEANRAAGMKHLTHFCNVMSPIHHIRFGMVGAGLMADDVFVEMICDGVHLCDQMIQLIAKLKGPEKMMLITDAMRASAMPDGNYTLGELPVVVRNGKAILANCGNVAGSTLRYFNGLRRLLNLTGRPLKEIIGCTAWNQASSLHLEGRGKLKSGFFADIAVLNQELEPIQTICEGESRWSRK